MVGGRDRKASLIPVWHSDRKLSALQAKTLPIYPSQSMSGSHSALLPWPLRNLQGALAVMGHELSRRPRRQGRVSESRTGSLNVHVPNSEEMSANTRLSTNHKIAVWGEKSPPKQKPTSMSHHRISMRNTSERCFVCSLRNSLHFMFKLKYLIIQLWIILIQIKFTKIMALCNTIFQYTCYLHFIMCFYSARVWRSNCIFKAPH